MKRLLIFTLLLAAMLFPLAAAASWFGGSVPNAAEDLTEELDEQLMSRQALLNPDADLSDKGQKSLTRAQILIMGTTPVNLNKLNTTCQLARQMTEEISSRLMQTGYRYQDLRKGGVIRFDRNAGEFVLTRDVRNLVQRSATGQAILAGTYVISGKHIRFTMSLLNALNNEVLAKSSVSVPITSDLIPLLDEEKIGAGSRGGDRVPNTYTPLQ